MFPGDWWNPGTGETAFFWHQVPAKQLMLRHKRHEPICKPYSEQYTKTIMSWFLIQKHWKILESFECSTSLKFADLFEMPKLLWRLPWRLSSLLGSLMTSRSSRMPDEAKRGTLRLENQKTTGLKKQIHGARCKKSKCSGKFVLFSWSFFKTAHLTSGIKWSCQPGPPNQGTLALTTKLKASVPVPPALP